MICTSYDDYLQDKDTSIWIAELNNGTMVYCDDGRYGEDDIAWRRLADFLKTNSLKIEKLFIKFRSHVELVSSRDTDTIGWYFGRGVSAWMGSPSYSTFIIGQVKSKDTISLKVSRWRVPEIQQEESSSEERDPSEYSINIIWDNNEQ